MHSDKTLSGADAEQLAQNYLQQQGLQLLAKNFRTSRGEIDLIMRDNAHLVFVEVRFRQSSAYGSAEESITPQKCQRLTAAALAYMQSHKVTNKLSARFDAVAISPPQIKSQTGFSINWIKNILQ
jgi:putative endonuclease|tara:strand:- start:3906 stop:4280 length:375 start_codon:yes stop_codon:yes gene_type:complete